MPGTAAKGDETTQVGPGGQLWAQIRMDWRELTASPEVTQADEPDFEAYCSKRTALMGRLMLLCAIVNLVVWIPTDFVIYAPVLRPSIFVFRALLLVLGCIGYLSLPRSKSASPQATTVVMVWYCLMTTVTYSYMGVAIDPGVPLLFTSLLLPAMTPVFLLTLRQRVFLNVATCLLAMGTYFGPHPQYWSHRYNGILFIYLSFATLMSTGIGHQIFRHERAGFQRKRQMREQTERLEELNRMKDGFLATVSHELRTPLNSILGLTDVLLEDRLDPAERRQYLRTIHGSGEVLLSLINDVLDLAKLKAGKQELETKPVVLHDLIDSSLAFFSLACQEKNLELLRYVPWDTPVILGDASRLHQILLNLLGNAVKFTPSGEISVIVSTEPLAESRVNVSISVADTGIGISPDKRERIFDEFMQVDASTTRRYRGTGLGLPIVRQLAGLMGGRVSVTYNTPRGSIFTVTFPAAVVPGAERAQGLPPELVAAHPLVLLCVAHPLRRRGMAEGFERLGLSVLAAATLEETAAQAEEARRFGRQVHLVLIVSTAVTAEALARSTLAPEKMPGTAVAIVVDTRTGQEELVRFRELGVRFLLYRPVRRSDMRAMLQQALSGSVARSSPETAVPAVVQEPARRRRILVVDDTTENRLLIGAYLRGQPLDVEFGESGAEAVEKFTQGSFDLVFLDLEMPGMDGYAAARLIREWERDHGKPPTHLIAFTAHGLAEHRERTREAGFSQHLTKPIRKQEFLRLIQQAGEAVSGENSPVVEPA